MARLLIGVTGGIAAYKALETVRLATAAGHAVRVVQTDNAARFVGPESFAAMTGAPVLRSEFQDDPLRGAYPGEPTADRIPIAHLALVQRADAYLIAPASANTIAKLAGGQADSLVTTAALAADCPVLVAPAMNDRMYRHPATQANLATLAARGITIIGPGEGALASHGEAGLGRLSEPAELLAAVEAALAAGVATAGAPATSPSGSAEDPGATALAGRRVLVTAGGTREPIDAVRFIGNRSSGRMGYALATRAAARGAEVTLVSANVALDPPPGVRRLEVSTAAELHAACQAAFDACDVLLMAAAVADFRPREPAPDKLKKDDGPPRLELEATEDVLRGLSARRRPGQVLVGFAAEHGAQGLGHAHAKLLAKRLDAIVLNDVARADIGFDAGENEVTILCADGRQVMLRRAAKETIADGILDRVVDLLGRERGEDVRRATGTRAARV